MYQLTITNTIIRLADSANIPNDDSNTDYAQYLDWLEAGNVPLQAQTASADDVWEAIKRERERRSEYGGYKVGTKWFHSDSKSKVRQIGLVMAGAGLPAGLQWKTMDGSFVVMTPTLAGQVFQAALQNDVAIFSAAEMHKASMQTDPANYNYLTGWPLGFGE